MLVEKLKYYHPKNEQERIDKDRIMLFLRDHPDAFERKNPFGHITSSAIIVNPSMTKVLFGYHKIYDAWGWIGGHNDGDTDTLAVALRETQEETKLDNVYPYSEDIFMVDIIYVEQHQKNGEYIGDHLHLNITYLLIAEENQPIGFNPDEHLGVRWFDIDKVLDEVDEQRMIPVYQKAFDAIKKINEKR